MKNKKSISEREEKNQVRDKTMDLECDIGELNSIDTSYLAE